MTAQDRPERVEDWEPVRDRILKVADRLPKYEPDHPVNMSAVLEIADHVSADVPPMVLAGMVAVIPNVHAGETNAQYAARLREAVAS